MLFAIENICLGNLEQASLGQRALHHILNSLNGWWLILKTISQFHNHLIGNRRKLSLLDLFPRSDTCFMNSHLNAATIKIYSCAISFLNMGEQWLNLIDMFLLA